MKAKGILIGLVCLPFLGTAQNLVPNGSFENYIQCPWKKGQIFLASQWLSPFFSHSSDLYHVCHNSINTIVGVPNNWHGHQAARNGKGYAGIIPFNPINWDSTQISDHEYITTYLEQELKEEAYCASFFVSNSDFFCASSPLGIHFSKDTGFYSDSSSGPLPLIPQVEYNGPPIQDTSGWSSIHGIFQGQGGEQYITIGNFRDCTQTELLLNTNNTNTAYYYIDDVSVVPLIPKGLPQAGDTTITRGEGVPLSQVEDAVADYTWSPSKGLDDPNSVSPIASPQETTTYTVTKTTQCSTTTAEVTVHVEPPPEEQVYVPNVFAPNAKGQAENRKFRVHGGPFREYHLQLFSRWGQLVFETRDPDEAWEGRYKGEPMKGGAYSYQFRGVVENGVEVERSGTVTLLR